MELLKMTGLSILGWCVLIGIVLLWRNWRSARRKTEPKIIDDDADSESKPITHWDKAVAMFWMAVLHAVLFALIYASVVALETFAGVKLRSGTPFDWSTIDWGTFFPVVVAVLSFYWVIYLSQRVGKLEDEMERKHKQITWLHKRVEKLEGSNIDSFVSGAHPQWQYDSPRSWINSETSSDGQQLNGS